MMKQTNRLLQLSGTEGKFVLSHIIKYRSSHNESDR